MRDQHNKVCVLEGMFKTVVRLPLLPVIREFLCELRLSPIQILLNGWRFMLACVVIWPMALGKGTFLTSRGISFSIPSDQV